MTGHEPRWDIDLRYGEDGEALVASILRLDGSKIEVKRKRRVDDLFYVETEQAPNRRRTYTKSGLATTKADYWAFVINGTGIVVLVPTERLRELTGVERQRD